MTRSDDTTSADAKFEQEVRAMLHRRAADIDPASLSMASPSSSTSRSWNRLYLAVAALAVVAALGAGAAISGLLDSSVEIEATNSNPTSGLDWPTATPGIELLPPGVLQPSTPFFGPSDGAGTLAEEYLADRLPDLMSARGGLTISEVETVDGASVFHWQFVRDDVDTAGYLYLRRFDGAWWLIAAVSEGVDAHRMSRDSQGLQGLVSSTFDEPMVVDLIDIETGDPFDPSTGELLPPGPTGRRLGTLVDVPRIPVGQAVEIDTPVGRQQYAIRIQAVGGTALTVTEFVLDEEVVETSLTLFVDPARIDQVVAVLEADGQIAAYQKRSAANTRAEYYSRFSNAAEVVKIWDDAAEIESISLALATVDERDVVIGELLQIDGVLAVVSTPTQADDGPEAEAAADRLVIETRSVPFRPTAIECEAPIGIETPPNRVFEVADALPALTPEDALARYLQEAADPPPWPSGYVQLESPDGSVAFGFADQPERYLGIVRVAESESGWAVTDWEIVGC